MKAYLAEKYMSGPKADAILARTTQKKKKRKADTSTASTSTSGTYIRDEDAGWLDQPQDVEDDIQDAVVEKDRGFKRRKVGADGTDSGGWATIREGVKEESPPIAADEQPQVVGGVEEEEEQPLRGGLLTKAQLRKTLGSKPKLNAEQTDEAAQETIYRDASGRKIDTKAEKAEAIRKKREKEEKEAKKMVWGQGLAQREEKEKTRTMMERERQKGFARHADDDELNEEQKAKELWNDPAAAFLTVRFAFFFSSFSFP
jgi:pre-mRNA-splicing factor CWC26